MEKRKSGKEEIMENEVNRGKSWKIEVNQGKLRKIKVN